MRPQFAVAIVLGDANRLEDADVAARHRQRHKAGLIDRLDERRRAAVHDRHFRPVDLDDGVIDAEARQRGEHMLGGRAERAGGIAQHGGKFGRGDGADVGVDFTVGLAVGAAAHEHDAGVGFGGQHGQRRRRARMHADAADRGLLAQRGLPAGFHAQNLYARSTPCTRSVQPREPGRFSFSPKMPEVRFAVLRRIPPPRSAEIPLVGEQFSARANPRQLTLSYRVLPLKRRKAAQNATAQQQRPYRYPDQPEHAMQSHEASGLIPGLIIK